jgi:hypothetical protein
MGDLIDLSSPRSRWFADSRGRSLKATWHSEAELVVLSLWESYRCVGTFQLPVDDAPQLMVLLAEAVRAWASQPEPLDLHLDATRTQASRASSGSIVRRDESADAL